MSQSSPNYPASLDNDNEYLFVKPNNNNWFTVQNSINVAALQVTVVGNGTIGVPNIAVFEGGEMWLVEQVSQNGTEWTITLSAFEQRAYGGSPLQVHTAGEKVYFGLLAEHLNRLRDLILTIQKTSMFVVATIGSFPSPYDGAIALETSTGKVWYRHSGVWLWANRREHSDLGNLLLGKTHHPQYLNESDFTTDHNEVGRTGSYVGVHITDGDNHSHLVDGTTGLAVKRIRAGTTPPTPSYAGEVYYETTEGILYISPDGVSWSEVSGAPTGAIAMFNPTVLGSNNGCPDGWSRVTLQDNKFVKASGTHGTAGGYNSHKHTYSQIGSHTHSVPGASVTVATGGAHDHAVDSGGNAGGGALWDGAGDGSVGTNSTGSHTHSFNVQRVISNTSVGTSETSTENVVPPYKEVVFCKKL